MLPSYSTLIDSVSVVESAASLVPANSKTMTLITNSNNNNSNKRRMCPNATIIAISKKIVPSSFWVAMRSSASGRDAPATLYSTFRCRITMVITH